MRLRQADGETLRLALKYLLPSCHGFHESARLAEDAQFRTTPPFRPGYPKAIAIATRSRIRHPRALDAWFNFRDYRLLWVANFCANTAMWLQLLTTGWLVKDLSEGTQIGGLLVASVGAINTLPWLVLNPLSGVLGDRLDRRKLVMVMHGLGAALALAFAFLAGSEFVRFWHPFAYVLISGAFLAINQPLQQVMVANSVPREMFSNAYALNVLTITGTRIFGPFAGGLLIFWLGYFWNFALESVLYLAVVHLPHPHAPAVTATPVPESRARTAGSPRWPTSAMASSTSGGSSERCFQTDGGVLHPQHRAAPRVVPAAAVHRSRCFAPTSDMGGYLLAITGLGGFISTLIIATFGLPSRYAATGPAGHRRLQLAACTMALAYSSWLPAAFFFLAAMSAFASPTTAPAQGIVVLTIVPDHFRARTLRRSGLRARLPHRRQRPRGHAGRRHLRLHGHPRPRRRGAGTHGRLCGGARPGARPVLTPATSSPAG